MSEKRGMTKEEIKLFKELQDKRKRQNDAFDFSMRGAIRGTEDIYPETAHFVYELLQNADDCGATEATFIISPTNLIFKHNGTEHFTITPDQEDIHPYGHINSITAYCSTKSDKEEQIGKFGIGFKSVYQYTENPEVYDDVFKFRIVNRMIPYLIDHDHPYRKAGETLFDLKFKDPEHDYDEIYNRLKELKDPVLFLPHITKIHWQIEGSDRIFSFARYERLVGEWSDKDIKCHLTTVDNNNNIERLYVFSKYVKVPVQKKTVEIKVGYYLDNQDYLSIDKRPNIYCFFPTEEKYHMCFVAHAPFLLTSNRAGLKKNDVNNFFHERIASLASLALLFLKEIGENNKQLLIDENLFKIIPQGAEVSDILKYNFNRVVKRNRLILSRERIYLGTNEILRGDSEDIETLLSKEQLAALYPDHETPRDFIFNKKDKRNDIDENVVKELGIEILNSENFSSKLSADFLKQQDEAWIDRFYNYIERHARQLWNKQDKKGGDNLLLRIKPIVRTTTGGWVTPYKIQRVSDGYGYNELGNWYQKFKDIPDSTPNVFLPMTDGTPLEGKHYQFVDASLYEKHKTFFIGMGLHQPNIIDFINLDILPKYRMEKIDGDDEVLVNDFKQLFNICHKSNDEQKALIRKLLYDEYYLRATDGSYYNINEVFDDTSSLRVFYGEDGVYLDYSYYSTPESKLSKEDIRKFALFLGINKEIKITTITSYNRKLASLYDISTRRPPDWWKDYEIEEYWSGCLNKEQSHVMWDFLCRLERPLLEEYLKAKCKGYQNYSAEKKIFTCDSTLLRQLKEDRWICNQNGNFCPPSGITKSEFVSLGYEDCPLITNLLGFKAEKPKETPLAALGATKEQQEDAELGRWCRQKGYTRKDWEDFDKWKASQSHHTETDDEDDDWDEEERNDVPNAPKPKDVSTPLDVRYGSKEHGEEGKVSVNIPVSKTRSVDLESYLERQKQRIETECEKEDLLNEMEDIQMYSKLWFLHGLKYEYLNSKDTGKDQISHSLSISFTKVVPEHSNVFKFCNASKPIPRWLEEIDGDIKVDFRFKNGDGVQVSFAMACVQDFSLRLRAKGNDEEALNKIVWEDLTSANLDINNPRGLVKNLYEAFRLLPFDDTYDLQANLKNNVQFVFGPPGTGKTTHITRRISSLIQDNAKCKILVLAPTNQACDVITKQLMKQNPNNYGWLGRFVATNDEYIDQMGVVCGRDSTIYSQDLCCVVSTMARLSYDFFESVGDGRHCLKDIRWDYVICDEGSMLSLPEVVYAIYKFSYDDNSNFINTPIIIAGDPKQLQPIDASGVWGKRSIYDLVKLDSFEKPVTTPIQFKITNLETQFRSVPAIGELFSRYSYNGLLKHSRSVSDLQKLSIRGLENIKPITYMPFLVDNYDDIYGAKKMAGSNVHIYSAIITAELCRYIAVEYAKGQPKKRLKIGVICPYIAQVQLVEKLLNEYHDIPFGEFLEIVVGTIHSFQGDECNVIFALFNPPKGMASKRQDLFTMLLNDDHLVNVAISRAADYLFIMVPTHDSFGRENLNDINRAADILLQKDYPYSNEVCQIDCSKLERLLFGEAGYLKKKSYITSHQMANVYTPTGYTYDIRVDESAIDIQIGDTTNKPHIANAQTISPQQTSTTPIFDSPIIETENLNLISDVPYREFIEPLLKAIKARDELSVSQLLQKPTGKYISLCRDALKKAIVESVHGEDFWYLLTIVLKYKPSEERKPIYDENGNVKVYKTVRSSMFRKPIIDALENTIDLKDYLYQGVEERFNNEIVPLLFNDTEKMLQDIDLLYIFRQYYKGSAIAPLKRKFYFISQPDYFFKLFEIFPELKDEAKINFLLDIHSQASLYVVCQLLADKNIREKVTSNEYCLFANPTYKMKVMKRLSGSTELDKYCKRIIQISIKPESMKEKKKMETLVADYKEFSWVLQRVVDRQKRYDNNPKKRKKK